MTYEQANQRFFGSARSDAAPDREVWAVLLRGVLSPGGLGNPAPPADGQIAVMFDATGSVDAWACYPLGQERTTDGLPILPVPSGTPVDLSQLWGQHVGQQGPTRTPAATVRPTQRATSTP